MAARVLHRHRRRGGDGDVLVHQVLKHGRLLLDRDPARRVRFEVAARRRYFDGQRRRAEYLRAILEAGSAAMADGLPLLPAGCHNQAVMARRGFTVWLTGLSGAGKTTISLLLEEELRRRGLPVERLDGDVVRQSLCRDLGFSREDRVRNLERVTFVAKLLTRHGVAVITAFISPYREAREWARREIEQEGGFVEVYVRCPLEECIRRDVKGLYARALRGEIPAFTGVSDPYEEPENPDIVVDTHRESPGESAIRILRCLEARRFVVCAAGAGWKRRATFLSARRGGPQGRAPFTNVTNVADGLEI